VSSIAFYTGDRLPKWKGDVQPAPDGIGAAQQSVHERAIDDDGLGCARAIAVA
jgi:hypothetical protein